MSCVTADARASADAIDATAGAPAGSTGAPPRIPISPSPVSPVITRPRGRQRHRAAVERLLESYQAIPPGAAVRLSKRTSNLFRPRAATDSPGLDVSGLDGVITVDATRRLAEVQGVCTYETLVGATLR